MNKKIFRASFYTALIVLLIGIFLVGGILFSYFEALLLSELKSEAKYISYAVENVGVSYVENFIGADKRITIVRPDGTVLADTMADSSELDNHLDREEVGAALEKGEGSSTRYSDTLMRKTVYYATKMSNGNVLRVSATQDSVLVILLGLMHPLIVVLIIALVVAFLLSHRASKAIVEPINAIDLDEPASNEAYEELTPLLRKISAQKNTIERHIREADRKKEQFKLITENMSEGLIVIDSNASVLTYNHAALRLLEVDEVKVGCIVFTLNRMRGFRTVIEKALAGERAESELSLNEHNYELIASPVLVNEKIMGAVIIIIDVTERVKREELRREFTSNISHELKTPLTSISGFAEIMKEGSASAETVIDFSKSIYEEAQRLISLVGDIMKISELDEGSVHIEKEKVDLYELANEVARRLKPYAAKKNITFSVKGESVFIFGAKKILDEMIYNLCDNAIKYNRENGRVDVTVKSEAHGTSITVKDTGIGIPAAEQGRIFERFYRVDKSHSKLVGGTGLGLSIVKHGAIYHNAEISVASAEDKGSCITVTFGK